MMAGRSERGSAEIRAGEPPAYEVQFNVAYHLQDHLLPKPNTPSQPAPGGLARKSEMRSR
jgi:hypothetical protein